MVGCAMSAFPFGQLLSTPLWGHLTDYCGDRHVSILAVIGFLTGLCCCLFKCCRLGVVAPHRAFCLGYVLRRRWRMSVAMTLFSVAGLLGAVASPMISGQLSFLGYGCVVSICGITNFVVSSLLTINSFMTGCGQRSHTQPVASEESHSFERSLASARFIL